ncbi:hypothetical protein B0H11DRAFT_1862898 [Mycena galericulata]|nr:hypothetical protein B0H11DRAFT_1862898 [Mycena galericulata]
MTSANFTIDNINPLIRYTPPAAWTEGTAANDPLASDYSNNGTFTLCTTQGSAATFTFNGTQVFVHGAKRSNHGPYSVTLDGTSTLFDGFADPPIFSTLFVSSVLSQGLHTVTVTNELNDTTRPFLDIDFITWTSAVSNNGETTTEEDTSAAFSYQPATSWNTDLSAASLTGFSSNNGHVTLTTGASTTVTFQVRAPPACRDPTVLKLPQGDYIAVFGPVGPTISRYTVSVDGVTSGTFNATKENYTPQVALYQASGLGSGQHTVELTSEPAVAGQFFAVDYAQVVPVASASATPTGSASGASNIPSGGSQSSVGPVVGGVLAGIAVLIVMFFILFCMRRRRQRRERDGGNHIILEDKYPPPPGAANYVVASGGAVPHHIASYPASASDGSTRYQGGGEGGPSLRSAPLTNPWEASTQRRGFRTVNNDPSAGSVSGSSSDGDAMSAYGGMASTIGGPTSTIGGPTSTLYSSGAAGLGAGGHTMGSRKGAPPPMPSTANQPLPPGAERMYVPGREQDFGPLVLPPEVLPPDYEQATEPYRGGSIA